MSGNPLILVNPNRDYLLQAPRILEGNQGWLSSSQMERIEAPSVSPILSNRAGALSIRGVPSSKGEAEATAQRTLLMSDLVKTKAWVPH